MRHYQRSGNYVVAAVSFCSGIDTINNIDAIHIIDDRKNRGTIGIDGIEGKDASVGRAGRCYHRLKSYVDSMLNRKMGLLLDDGMQRIEAMEGLMMAMLSLA